MQITEDKLVFRESGVWVGERYISAGTIKWVKHTEKLPLDQTEHSWSMSRKIGKQKHNKSRDLSKMKKGRK